MITTIALNQELLLLGFYAVGNNFQVQTPGHCDDSAHDRLIVGIEHEVPDERMVNLQLVQGQLLEVLQRGETGTKVIQSKTDTINGVGESEVMSQPAPTSCIHVPQWRPGRYGCCVDQPGTHGCFASNGIQCHLPAAQRDAGLQALNGTICKCRVDLVSHG